MLYTFNMLIECQDCIGAIDCTHVRVKVPAELAASIVVKKITLHKMYWLHAHLT